MAKRLHMTTADYVAIAVSPALIMALVGSLVFFLIEVLYVGEYHTRLNYVFAWFVFAAVLIGRISIEMGSERAAIYGLPLGIATFLGLIRFVDHPSPFSHLINLALMAVVWWCAHRLTWDCTLIDDDLDASGEGLMQKIGVDGENVQSGDSPPNELFSGAAADKPHNKPHTPGLWVLYFSLAALPLFGIGQQWIPASDVGRRRYAFALLVVYVAAGLSLLVTTSFLGLRRYLRQRKVEMPAPMAATWGTFGGVLIVMMIFLAALVPRPQAEYAISQVPWRAGSPKDLSASRFSAGDEPADQQQPGEIVSDEEDAPPGSAVDEREHSQRAEPDGGSRESSAAESQQDGSHDDSPRRQDSDRATEASREPNDDAPGGRENGDRRNGSNQKPRSADSGQQPPRDEDRERTASREPGRSRSDEAQRTPESRDSKSSNAANSRSKTGSSSVTNPLQSPSFSLGGLTGVLKLVFYAIAVLIVAYLVWKHHRQLIEASVELFRELRALFARLLGGRPTDADDGVDDPSRAAPQKAFAEYQDPFTSGLNRQLPPDELVQYTFEAFEAWARDRGYPRSPDRTPLELIRVAVAPKAPMYEDAKRLARLYNEAAYAPGALTRESADSLRPLWSQMRAAQRPTAAATCAG